MLHALVLIAATVDHVVSMNLVEEKEDLERWRSQPVCGSGVPNVATRGCRQEVYQISTDFTFVIFVIFITSTEKFVDLGEKLIGAVRF